MTEHSNPRYASESWDAMPDFWTPNYFSKRKPRLVWGVECLVFKGLSLISFGVLTLEPVWDVVRPGNEQGFREYKDRIQSQTQNMNVVAGLLLATDAVFLTTNPPRPDLNSFTVMGIYICLLSSFAMAMGSLLAGSSLVFVLNHCTSYWFRTTLSSSRIRLSVTMYLVGYPFLSIAAAGGLCGAAGLIASILSNHVVVYLIALVTLSMPVFGVAMFLIMVLTKPPPMMIPVETRTQLQESPK